MEQEKTKLSTLVFTFFKIGIMTFGGGYAMLPMLEKEIVQKHKWATYEEILDYFAIGQTTPGIIAVNTATFIGYKTRKNLGGVVATIGILLPSLIIITALASVLRAFQNNIYLAKAFSGIRISVSAMILGSVVKMAKKSIKNLTSIVLCLAALLSELVLGISPIIITICTIGLSLIVYFAKKQKEAK